MGKIVKFCSSCDEGFAEKFGFCPNCGQSLQTFEMNPVEPAAPAFLEPAAAPVASAPVEPVEMPAETVQEAAPVETVEIVEEVVEETPVIEDPVVEAAPVETVTAPVEDVAPAVKAVPAAASTFVSTTPIDVDRKPVSLEAEHNAYVSNGEFYVTVIEEKNVGTRNSLLVGTMGFMLFALMTGVVINLFSKDLEVGSINDDIFNAVIVDDVPTAMEEQEKQKKDKDGGGGGGGGRDEKEETTQGDLADQSKNPTRPPDAKVFRSDNFELKTPRPQTEGNQTFEKKFDRWGDPNGRFASYSNGTGTGGGQGSGTGTGQGSGRGTGAGSGDGSGTGSGLGTGNGSGTGVGDDGPPPPVRAAGVTTAMRIISKPKPPYTDAARTNATQGTVVLKVTFLASGQIGSVSAVRGLPYGLTESAIAAAKRISFEPKKVDGVAQSTTRTIEYTFGIY